MVDFVQIPPAPEHVRRVGSEVRSAVNAGPPPWPRAPDQPWMTTHRSWLARHRSSERIPLKGQHSGGRVERRGLDE